MGIVESFCNGEPKVAANDSLLNFFTIQHFYVKLYAGSPYKFYGVCLPISQCFRYAV